MGGSTTPKESSLDIASFLFLAIGATLILAIGYFLFSNIGKVRTFLRESDTYPLAISTSPNDANVVLDGQVIGKSPVTVLTFPGAHVITVRKDGYQPQSQAFELSRDQYTSDKEWKQELIKNGSPWSYNFKLAAVSNQIKSNTNASTKNAMSQLDSLQSQIKDLHSLILANPEQSLNYGLMKNRIDSLEKGMTDLREQARFSNNLSVGLWATLVAIFLTLATVLFSRHKPAQ